MSKMFTKEQELQICKEYFSPKKLSTTTLAEKWNCGDTTIGDIIRKNGFVLRLPNESHKGQKTRAKIFTKKEEKQICKEYFSKKKSSTYTLAKKWSCSDCIIGHIIRRNGFSLRSLDIVNSTPKAIHRALKNCYGTNCYYRHKFFPSLSERDCYIYLIKLGYKVIHNFLGRFDFLLNNKIVVEFHPFDFNLTNKQYYIKRRKLLDKYGYRNLKLVVIKDLKEIETKLISKEK